MVQRELKGIICLIHQFISQAIPDTQALVSSITKIKRKGLLLMNQAD